MGTSHTDLYFEHLKGQAQFAYFQLGVAASAIAFAIHETDGHALRETPWLIGLAVALWAISFALGCFGVTARQRGMLTNLQYLEATRDAPPLATIGDAELVRVLTDAKRITQQSLDRPGPRFRWQLWTLFFGALAYIGGHVMQMATLNPAAAAYQASRPLLHCGLAALQRGRQELVDLTGIEGVIF